MLRPNVSHCVSENDVHYNPFSWAEEYLTFVAKENCTFTFTQRNGYAISYSIDNGKTWEVPASTTHQTVSAGSKVIWKSADIMNTTNSTNGGLLRVGSTGGIGTFASTGHFEVQGNIMSLIRGDSFANADELINGKEFIELFKGCTGLTSAENLILPATTLIDNCYKYMFSDCTSLTKAPELPATTLARECYAYMFDDCTNLTTAPELPATTLANYCYQGMFRDCTSLTTASALPATELANWCYEYMFRGCTSLVTTPELPATTLAIGCYSTMFQDCTSLTTAPELSATTLINNCYYYMFDGCTSLNYIKTMFTTTPSGSSPNYYTTDWVNGVAASGTFVKNSAATWTTTGVNGIPEGWTIETVTA